ncbi:MAG: DUF6629 family protein [Lyngbya sp.]|nr:DUF6629 family protein [Lyngbya sp.]
MCFSPSASFVASTLLISSGSYCISRVIKTNSYPYLPIAVVPIFFGIQQGFEGMVWLSLNGTVPQATQTYALGFLFFSHFLWLFWMNISVLVIETRKTFKKVLVGLAVIGFLDGVFLYFPLLLHRDWLSVSLVNHSIQYQIHVLSSGLIPPLLGICLYVIVCLTGLFVSENKELNYLGGLLFVAFILTKLIFDYALISVWCFFAAVISCELIYVFYSEQLFEQVDSGN